MTDTKPKSDTVLIKDYFDMTATQAKGELMGPNGCTADDRAQLAKGIRDGSLTY